MSGSLVAEEALLISSYLFPRNQAADGQRLGECRRLMHRNLFMKPTQGQPIVRLFKSRPSDGDHVPVDPARSERALSLLLSAAPPTRGESNCHVLHFERLSAHQFATADTDSGNSKSCALKAKGEGAVVVPASSDTTHACLTGHWPLPTTTPCFSSSDTREQQILSAAVTAPKPRNSKETIFTACMQRTPRGERRYTEEEDGWIECNGLSLVISGCYFIAFLHATIINIMIVVAAPIVSPSSYLFVAECCLVSTIALSLSLCTRQSPALCFIFLLMAKEWEMTNFTVGMGMASSPAAEPFTAASASPVTTCLYGTIPPIVDELLDLSSSHHDDCFPSAEGAAPPGGLASFSEFKPLQAPNSSFDLYIPQCEDAAELEWLSKFVDDSFSDVPCYNSGLGAVTAAAAAAVKREPLPRSRAERASSVSAAWSSLVAGTAQNASPSSPSSSSSSEFPEKVGSAGDARKGGGKGKKGGCGEGSAGGVRRCSHCASEKTPQWRTGPLGPKTLCNACGVRYKSGRLVQEYRPAASPTFVLSQHSNSHRKVMELRRQKEMLLFGHRTQQEGDASSCSAISELIHGDYSIS